MTYFAALLNAIFCGICVGGRDYGFAAFFALHAIIITLLAVAS